MPTFTVRTELEILPPHVDRPCSAELEFAEHGSLGLRVLMAHDDPRDNRVDATWTLTEGGTVLIPGSGGGWCMLPLERDAGGWFVKARERTVRVVLDDKRAQWVVKEML